MKNQTKFNKNNNFISLILISISFLIGIFTIYMGEFGDESDNLIIGYLITQGYDLYSDIFSHHFPFTYYWVAFVITIFGNLIFFTRLSIFFKKFIPMTLLFRITLTPYSRNFCNHVYS